jgi:membrane protease YdiL (CAAX protease family)
MTTLRSRVAAHPIASFFVLAYAISWSIDLAVRFAGMEPSWTRWFFAGFLSALGPPIAAAVVIRVTGGSLRAWLSGLVRWRVHPKWYAAAVGIPVGLTLAAGVVALALGNPIDFGALSVGVLPTFLIGLVLATFVGGGQEEAGWRGYAQPALQERYGAFRAALVVGVLWGGWHLPLFFDPAAPHAAWSPLEQGLYFVGLTGFSVLLAWLYNGTGGSILLVMLMHGAENAAGALVPVDLDVVFVDGVYHAELLWGVYLGHALLTWVLVLVVLAAFGARHLARRSAPTVRSLGVLPETRPAD